MTTARPYRHWPVALAATLAIGACAPSRPIDLDMRGAMGGVFDTRDAVAQGVAPRPDADNRGVISYPSYQVAVAARGDTVGDVAARVGLPAGELAQYNGLPLNVALRRGEIIALPRRVSEPSPATGAVQTGPIRTAPQSSGLGSPEAISTGRLADDTRAPDRSGAGAEPTRHRVVRGETAFSIARRYNVPVQALGQWNGLDQEYRVREGQFLLIPVAQAAPPVIVETPPGAGSVAPVPPSSAQPLPEDDATIAAPESVPASPDLGAQTTAESGSDARFVYPVTGSIIRPFVKGRNDGIDIAATPGTPVRAAGAGTVAAITRDTDQVPILVLRHDSNVLTVYAGVEGIGVSKGDTVSRGQVVARIRDADPAFLHFEVREGFESVDPVGYLE